MSIDRLSPTDRLMLLADDAWPQEIGALAILDGDGGRLDVTDLRRRVASRLHLVPRLRQVILNVLDHGMTLADAMAAPRLHHQAWPDAITVEAEGLTPSARDSLVAMGHTLRNTRSLTNVNAVMRGPGGWHG